LSCCYNICILANVGEWPKDLAIRRIAKIVVHAGYIVDGVTITYELTNDKTVTVQDGGTGGGERLNLTLTGNFLFYFWMSEFCSLPWDYSKPESYRCLWSPAQ
jgi:hypothetical protein